MEYDKFVHKFWKIILKITIEERRICLTIILLLYILKIVYLHVSVSMSGKFQKSVYVFLFNCWKQSIVQCNDKIFRDIDTDGEGLQI